MRAFKIVIPVVLAGAISFSWFQFAETLVAEKQGYQQCIQKAEESQQKGLYEQAIEYYKKCLSYEYDSGIYQKISDVCKEFYSEENVAHVRQIYIDNMLEAAEAVPKESSYWITAIELYKEKNDYSSAYAMIKKARGYNIQNEELNRLYQELRYMIQINSYTYDNFKTASNGYVSVHDKNGWEVTNQEGKVISTESYQLIGLLNDQGSGVYIDDIGVRLLDGYEIARARFDFSVEDAGIYSAESGYIPVLKDGKWRYVNLDGEFLSGEYETASCFVQGKAAVKEKNTWYLIDENGQKVSDDYEEIKLDLYGSYLQNHVILAKSQGKYHIYNSKWEQIGNFACDDIDICLENNWIAYQTNGKWGFVDTEGNIMVEPVYAKAKSFSNNMAAVYNGKKWGFINAENQVVIDYQFQDAFYFNSKHYCIISLENDSYQFMYLMFE